MAAPAGLPAGTTWKGVWTSTTTYALYDVVSFSGRFFKATKASTSSTPPGVAQSSNTSWEEIFVSPSGPKVDAAPETMVNAVAATGSVTFTGLPADGDTVTLNGKVYTFKTALSTGPTVPGQILIGANITATALNLSRAISAGAGAGSLYSTGTLGDTALTASPSAGVLSITAATKGEIGNTYTLTKAAANTAVSGAALTGGVDGTPTNGRFMASDGTYLYIAVAENTTAGANWRRIALGSAF